MKEVKTPRKPFIFYYIVVLLILMLINMFVMPTIREASIKKVDYNEFMNMTLNKQIKKVEIDDSQITFTDQNGPCLHIAFDAIMEALSGYQADYSLDRENAFLRWELPARFLGYRLLLLGLRNGWPILFEHSNALREHVDLYKKIKSLGYRIHMVCIDATPEMVIKRLARRNRFFPEEQVKKRWDCLIDLLPEYQKIVDDFKLIQPWKNVENL